MAISPLFWKNVTYPERGKVGVVQEVFNALGQSIVVITVPLSAIAPLSADQIPADQEYQ